MQLLIETVESCLEKVCSKPCYAYLIAIKSLHAIFVHILTLCVLNSNLWPE